MAQSIAQELHTITYEQLIELFNTHSSIATISATFSQAETLQCALSRISSEAITAVNDGASLLLIDDADAHLNERLWIDPHLVTAKVHQVLSENKLRRNCSLVIRSGALRSLHDIVTLHGLGADSINPYLLFATVNDGTKHQLRIYTMHLIKDWRKSFQQLEFMNCVVTVASILLLDYMRKSQIYCKLQIS